MIRMTKVSAVMLALLFSAGAMAQSAGSSAGTSMHNTGDDNARPTASPVGTAPMNSSNMDKSTTHKAKKMKKTSKKSDDSMNSSNGGAAGSSSAQ